MHCQALDQGEILSIRWAHDDPNPVAKDSIERADKDAMVALLQAKGISLTPASYDYPMDYQLPQAKRLKVEDGGDGILSQHPELAYPDTDAQYSQYYANAAASASSSSGITSDINSALEAKKNALERLGLLYEDNDEKKAETEPAAQSEAVEGEGDDEEADEEDEEGEGGWQPYVDETTGATYYFNSATGESSWTKPAELEALESTASKE